MSHTSLESIFFAALEHPLSERGAYLDAACGGDAELRACIEKMLATQTALAEFLDRPHPIPAEALQPVKRRVALKLVRGESGGSRGVLARFESERQVIALTDHPHIAKLLDAGTTGESEAPGLGVGRPYFVMELVKGIPLNESCDQEGVGPGRRAALRQSVRTGPWRVEGEERGTGPAISGKNRPERRGWEYDFLATQFNHGRCASPIIWATPARSRQARTPWPCVAAGDRTTASSAMVRTLPAASRLRKPPGDDWRFAGAMPQRRKEGCQRSFLCCTRGRGRLK